MVRIVLNRRFPPAADGAPSDRDLARTENRRACPFPLNADPPAAPRRVWLTPSSPVPGAGIARGQMALLATLTLSAAGNTFVFAVLPPMGRVMALPDIATGAIVAIGSLAFVVGSPWWGSRSERIGRKRVIVLCLAIASVTTALFGLVADARLAGLIGASTALGLLILGRVAVAGGMSGVFPTVQAWIADTTPVERRAAGMGRVGAAFALGAVAGPALAVLSAGFGLTAPIYVVAVMLMAAVFAIHRFVPEPVRAAPLPAGQGDGLNVRTVFPLLLMVGVGVTCFGVIQQTTGLRFQDQLGMGAAMAASHAGMALATMAAAMVTTQLTLVQRLGWHPLTMMRLGYPGAAMALVFAAYAPDFTSYLVALAAYGLCVGLIMPGVNAMISITAGPNAQGRVAGLTGAAQGAGMAIGPLAGAAIHQLALPAPCLMAAGLSLAMGVVALARRRT